MHRACRCAKSSAGVAALALAVTAATCGRGAGPATPTTPTATVPTTPSNPCAVQAGGPPGPIADPNGPFYHQVVVARTTDGITLSDVHEVIDHASVPDGARLPDGAIGIYYVNGAQGGLWLARLVGGTATPVGPISLDGIANPGGAADPDATALPDGRIRLVYLSNLASIGGTTRAMCMAESSDGLNFTVVGPAITFSGTTAETDPSITQAQDGSWLMAISRGQQTLMARAGDGRNFTIYDTLGYGGVPEVTTLADGRVRLYVCATGIQSYLSSDAGLTWRPETTVVPPNTLGRRIVCDPSMVAGTDVFVFKTGL